MVSVLISDLIPILQQPRLMLGMEEERQKLLQLFSDILPAIPCAEFCEYVAESQAESEAREARQAWLWDLNAAAYEADDIVDEFKYATLRAEVKTDRHQSGDKVRTSIFSLCKIISGRTRLPSMEGMRERLTEIVIRMGDLVERSTGIISREGQGLMPCAEGWQDPTLSSLKEIDPIIVGREEEKEEIVHQLLYMPHNAVRNTTVLPIVGDQGVGKSTLARLICGDARIKGNFEVILWVNVGQEEFDVGRIAKPVIDQVIGKDCCLSEGDSDLLQRRIYQELSGKRYLLVLDDVWNEDQLKWEQLMSWFEQSVSIGSSIIVTTSAPREEDIMSSVSMDPLEPLMWKDLWTLLCRRAFISNKEISREVYEISQQILYICQGSPLLVNLMGGLMRFLKEPAEWQELNHHLNNNKIRYYFEGAIIELCINHLSPKTRECFIFCSVFPDGH